MAQTANNGRIIVTTAGASVPYAADYQRVFDSEWPSIQCAFETLQTVAPSGSITVPHNLGFYPMVMTWTISGGISIGRSFAFSGNLSGPQNEAIVQFDKVNLYITNGDASNSYTLSIKCFNIDITKSIDYTLPKPPVVKTKYDPTEGIKVSKYSKSIGSTDLRDFILHSRAQSPAVLSIQSLDKAIQYQPFGTFSLYDIIYTNPANYLPWGLAYTGTIGGKWQALAPGTQQSGNIFIIAADVTQFFSQDTQASAMGIKGSGSILRIQGSFSGANTNTGTLIMLRDPLVIANTVSVTY